MAVFLAGVACGVVLTVGGLVALGHLLMRLALAGWRFSRL